MSAIPLDRVRATLFSANGLNKIVWLDKARNIQWTEENSKPGWATFEVPLENEDGTPYAPIEHLLDRRIVKFWWYRQGKRNGTFACRLKGEAVQVAVDGRRWLRFEQQPGLLDLLGDATVYPEYGLRRASSGTRIFGFMSKDGNWRADGNWHFPHGFPLSDMTGVRKGAPPELRTPNPYWIAVRNPSIHLSPTTVNYVRASFHLSEGKYCELDVTADNILTVYLDGEQIIDPDKTTPLQWKHTQSVRFRISAGDHVLAFKDENAPQPGDSTAYTPVGLIGVLYELDTSGKVVDTILETNLDGSIWRVHDNTPQPGWSRAQVLRQLVLEAKARGVDAVTYLRLGFGDFHDTAGRAWVDRDEYQFDVGTVSVSDVAQQLAEAKMDVAVEPTSMRLMAWRRRGRDRSATVQLRPGDQGGNLKSFEASSVAARFTTVLTQSADTLWVETSDEVALADPHRGRIEVGLSLGSTPSSSTANSLAKSQLFENSNVKVTVTSEPSTLTGAVAYKDYFVGDTITVPGRRNIGTMKARVLAITVDASGDTPRAWPEYVEDPT